MKKSQIKIFESFNLIVKLPSRTVFYDNKKNENKLEK